MIWYNQGVAKKAAQSKMRVLEFSASITREDKWYLGSINEVPGVHSQGKTLIELEENLKDALTLMMTARRSAAAGSRRSKSRRTLPIAVEVV